jgi:hypothetical protein
MNDEDLFKCNATELVQIARRQGLPALRRDLPKEQLVAIVTGYQDPDNSAVAGTQQTRAQLEKFLADHWGVVRSQLPGCNGRCTSYPCSEARHAMCFMPNVDQIQFGLK